MKSSAEAFKVRGRRLVCVWTRPEPPKRGKGFPAVLFLHGFPGSQKSADIQHALLQKGVASLALHFSGAWGSDGLYRFSTLVSDAKAGFDFMAKRPGVDPARLGVFGFSMGGWTALRLAGREPRLKALAAVAPMGGPEMVRPEAEEMVARFGRTLRIGSGAALYRDFVKTFSSCDPAGDAARRACPFLLVHGTADEVIPPEVSKRLFAAARPPKRLVLEPGARHDFLDRREALTRLCAGWLAKELA